MGAVVKARDCLECGEPTASNLRGVTEEGAGERSLKKLRKLGKGPAKSKGPDPGRCRRTGAVCRRAAPAFAGKVCYFCRR